jgi:TRAP-type mannitol/chloroaromatic compound transport system substrate-binding protein
MWPPALDVLQGNAQKFARIVDELSGGRLKIQVFAGGELMPPTGVFDACLQGTVEAFNGAAYYWAGKENALQWFTSVPFGLNTQGYMAWYQQGGGLALWEEAYAPFGVVPRPGQSTNPQMGGWFRKKINTVDDLKGLKIRIPGLAGKVYAKAGAAVVLLPPGEIYTALERGTLDAAEFIGPHDDLKLGFQNAARYYYYPGWHEATSIAEFSFNKKAYMKNATGLQRLNTEFKTKVELIKFPDALLDGARKVSAQVMHEEADKSPLAKKVAAGYDKFLGATADWAKVEGAYYSTLSS